jgi:hypothetical protein
MSFKPVDTNIKIIVGPLIDDTDFKTREEAVAYNATGMEIDVILEKTDGTITTTAVTPTSGGLHDWAHTDQGYYELEIPGGSGDYNNTEEGMLTVVGYCDGVLPFRSVAYDIVPAAVYNAIVKGTGNLTTELASSTITSAKFDLSTAYPVGAGINFQTLYNNISTMISKLPTAYIMGSDDQNSHDTDIDAILEDTGTTLPATLAYILEDTGTTLPAALASILEDTGTTLPASLTTILGDTNELQTDWANGGRLDLLIDWIINVLEGDETVDTTTTPWQKVVKIKSTDTELIRKDLKDTAGSNVTSTSSVIGQSTEPA